MSGTYVIGVGMTPFGRMLDKSVKDLTREAVSQALADAGAAIGDVGAAYFSNTTQGLLEGQHLVPAQMALRDMGFEGIPMSNVENACASASTAFQHAHMAIKAGVTDVALAVGVDKMYHADKARSFEIFDGAWDVHDVDRTLANLAALGEGMETPAGHETPEGMRSVFMDVYAAFGKFHMKTFGSTQAQFAAVAAKNHRHSVHNPLSQYQDEYSVDEVLAARAISWPLTLPMCSPISDGGSAALLCSEDALGRFAHLDDAPGIRLGGDEVQVRHLGDGVTDGVVHGPFGRFAAVGMGHRDVQDERRLGRRQHLEAVALDDDDVRR